MKISNGLVLSELAAPKLTAIIICADDFGQSEAIDDGIRRLAAQARLSAVSCLSEGPCFAKDIAAILDMDIDLGLHLNFTEVMGRKGLYLPISRLIAMSYLGALNNAEIAAQIHRQLDAFEKHAGRPPDFIDGHQHVHQLPQIREPLLAILTQRYASRPPWLRHTRPRRCPGLPLRLQFKAALIAALGARGLSRLARKYDFSVNARLLGVYDFAPDRPGFALLLDNWLGNARHGDVLMCHPASNVSAEDALGQQRVREFEILAGEDFTARLDRFQRLPARFGNL